MRDVHEQSEFIEKEKKFTVRKEVRPAVDARDVGYRNSGAKKTQHVAPPPPPMSTVNIAFGGSHV